MENFKKYYKFPLKADDMGVYVRTIDNEMALMFTIRLNNDIIQNIVDKLNGESDRKCIPAEWHIKNGTEVWFDETKVMLIRGWGMLHGTGNGCYNLPEEEAIKIQDEFGKYVIDTLNS
jgi:hypothetical protein